MHELTTDNVLDYLRGRGWLHAGPASAEALGGGVSNQVLRIRHAGGDFVLKQSRPQLRTRDAWFSDLERIWREQEVMQTLGPLLPGIVPEVLFVDRDNFVYAMAHAPLKTPKCGSRGCWPARWTRPWAKWSAGCWAGCTKRPPATRP